MLPKDILDHTVEALGQEARRFYNEGWTAWGGFSDEEAAHVAQRQRVAIAFVEGAGGTWDGACTLLPGLREGYNLGLAGEEQIPDPTTRLVYNAGQPSLTAPAVIELQKAFDITLGIKR